MIHSLIALSFSFLVIPFLFLQLITLPLTLPSLSCRFEYDETVVPKESEHFGFVGFDWSSSALLLIYVLLCALYLCVCCASCMYVYFVFIFFVCSYFVYVRFYALFSTFVCFCSYFPVGDFNETTPMEQQPIYTEDWIGLQELNNASKIEFLV